MSWIAQHDRDETKGCDGLRAADCGLWELGCLGSCVASQGHSAGADVGAARATVVDGSRYSTGGRRRESSGWADGEADGEAERRR